MNHVKNVERRPGQDVGYHSDNIHPLDREGCVGSAGIDKMESKPNIIIKAGPNAKWYLKRFQKDEIEDEIEKQKWRDTSRCSMYIIEWDE